MFSKIKQYIKKLKSTGFLSVFSSSFLSKVINFAYGIILVRVISKADYGIYSYANNTYSYFNILLGFGIASAILQICCEDKEDIDKKNSHFSFGFSFSIYFNTLLSILVVLFGLFVPLPIVGSNRLLIIMGLLPVFTQFPAIYSSWLRANYQNNKYAILNIVNVVSITVFSIIGAIIYGSIGLIIGRYVAEIIAIATIVILKCPIPKLLSFSRMKETIDSRKILKIAMVVCISEALVQIISLVGTTILGLFTSSEEIIAAYKTATTIPTALAFISNAILIYAYPYFVKNKDDIIWTKKHLKLLFLFLFLISSVITIFCIFLSKQIIVLFFGIDYLDSIEPFKILMISFLFNSVLRIPCVNLILSQLKLKFSMFLSIFTSLLTVVLNIILISNYESIGAALSQCLVMLATGLVGTIYYLYVIRKKGKEYEEISY